jgi:hypothetical protein
MREKEGEERNGVRCRYKEDRVDCHADEGLSHGCHTHTKRGTRTHLLVISR